MVLQTIVRIVVAARFLYNLLLHIHITLYLCFYLFADGKLMKYFRNTFENFLPE